MMEIGNMLFGNSRGAFPIQRFPAQETFARFFENCLKCDFYGYPAEDSKLFNGNNYVNETLATIDNDVFTVRPYYWGEDQTIADLPNFVYKPEGIEIQWYKYPLRDAYSNVALNDEKLKAILDKCTAFVNAM